LHVELHDCIFLISAVVANWNWPISRFGHFPSGN